MEPTKNLGEVLYIQCIRCQDAWALQLTKTRPNYMKKIGKGEK